MYRALGDIASPLVCADRPRLRVRSLMRSPHYAAKPIATHALWDRTARPMQGPSARAVMCIGACVLIAAGLAGVWEWLAGQAPGTPLYIGMLPAPIERLRAEAFDYGTLVLIAGLALGQVERNLPRRVPVWLALGAALLLASSLYAATTGMPGVQLRDLRPDATWVFLGKLLGRSLLLLGLADIGWRVLGRRQE